MFEAVGRNVSAATKILREHIEKGLEHTLRFKSRAVKRLSVRTTKAKKG